MPYSINTRIGVTAQVPLDYAVKLVNRSGFSGDGLV